MLANFFRNRVVSYYMKQPSEKKDQILDQILAFQIGPYGWLADISCALLFGGNLKMLATIYMTDKWNRHWYAQHYEDFLRKDRRKKINVLEIGIGGYDDPRMGGSSLRMWRTYFPNGHVYGVDIYDKSPHNGRRIKTFKGSQADPLFLDNLVHEIGEIDIVVDDGSHRSEHVLFSFEHLFPHLAEGGIYAVEDTQTSYWSEYGGNEVDRNDSNTTMGYFKSLADGLNWGEFKGNYNPTYLDLNVKSISFYHNMIVIRKGSNRERSCPPN